MANLLATKPLKLILDEAHETGEHSLRRALGVNNLIALGIGAIIGTGIFVLAGTATANFAGPAIVLSFVLAATGCVFAGLCYAEFASAIPVAGSAYTYGYASLGEIFAWIIGWDLVLEYAFGAATVASGWSGYLLSLLGDFGIKLPASLAGTRWDEFIFYNKHWEPANLLMPKVQSGEIDITGLPHQFGAFNLFGFLAIMIATLILVVGIKESANFNTAIVYIKVCVLIVFVAVGGYYLLKHPELTAVNWHPFMPPNTGVSGQYGWSGVSRGAAVIFFAYIGFDAVSTAAQEAKNPSRDMPIGILGSLVICTILYVLFAHVLSGVATVEDFRTQGKEASVTFAITKYMTGYGWLAKFVTVAILAGFSSVILVMLLGQSRVFYSMSRDGLVPKIFSDVHPKYHTPYKSNMLFFVFTALFAAFIPDSVVGDMTSIGTLFAFMLVCASVWILRVKRPELPRAFRAPAVPVVSTLGILVCGAMIYGLGKETWIRLIVWLVIGLFIYFGYSRSHSKIAATGSVR